MFFFFPPRMSRLAHLDDSTREPVFAAMMEISRVRGNVKTLPGLPKRCVTKGFQSRGNEPESSRKVQ
jgi:hypothetical protein